MTAASGEAGSCRNDSGPVAQGLRRIRPRSASMRELNVAEVQAVSGGALPAVVIIAGGKALKWLVVGAAAGAGYVVGTKIVEAME